VRRHQSFDKDVGRHILNEEHIQELMQDTLKGMEVRLERLDDLPFEEQARLFSCAGVVVGVHGTGLLNTVFMPAGGAVIEVHPPLMHVTVWRSLFTMFGLAYFPYVVGRRDVVSDPSVDTNKQDLLRYSIRGCGTNYWSSPCFFAGWYADMSVDLYVMERLLEWAYDVVMDITPWNPAWLPPPTL